MKKIITSIAALLLFAGVSNAAETTENQGVKTAQGTLAPAGASSLISSKSVAQLIEENADLRMKVEEMEDEAENMNSLISYSKMMYVTISNLQEDALLKQQEDAKSQLDYARMMNATMINLTTVLVKRSK